MPEADEKKAVVQQWLKKAENDLKNAVYTIALGKDCNAELETRDLGPTPYA